MQAIRDLVKLVVRFPTAKEVGSQYTNPADLAVDALAKPLLQRVDVLKKITLPVQDHGGGLTTRLTAHPGGARLELEIALEVKDSVLTDKRAGGGSSIEQLARLLHSSPMGTEQTAFATAAEGLEAAYGDTLRGLGYEDVKFHFYSLDRFGRQTSSNHEGTLVAREFKGRLSVTMHTERKS